MTPIETLERIIEEEGSCNWIREDGDARSVCDNCPINSGNTNCSDFAEELNKGGKKNAQEHNLAYKRLAERKLVEIAFEEILKGDDDRERDRSPREDSRSEG